MTESDVGIRQGWWKAVRFGGIKADWSLFDLTKDVSADHPEQVREMVETAEAWSKGHTEPDWFDNLKARDKWVETEMPNFEEIFRLD